MLELDRQRLVIGSKQVKKALNMGRAQLVYLAADAEPHVQAPLKDLCKAKGVECIAVKSMQLLGQSCGIEVGAATAALLVG